MWEPSWRPRQLFSGFLSPLERCPTVHPHGDVSARFLKPLPPKTTPLPSLADSAIGPNHRLRQLAHYYSMRGPAHLLSSLTSGDDRTTLSDVLASAPAQLMQTPVQRETEASAVLRNALSTYTDQQVEASREDLLRSGYYRSALLARRRMQAKQKEAWWTRVLCAVFVAALLVAALLVGSIFARDEQVKTFSPNQNPQVKSPVGGFTKQQTPRSIYSITPPCQHRALAISDTSFLHS